MERGKGRKIGTTVIEKSIKYDLKKKKKVNSRPGEKAVNL